MIKQLTIHGLYGHQSVDLNFNEDINLITGKNGSGKTTVLKLVWYMISGNLERILREMTFDYASITTDKFTLSIAPGRKGRERRSAQWKLHDDQRDLSFGGIEDAERIKEGRTVVRPDELEILNHEVARYPGGSVFFPTFRRIEGGFSMGWGARQASDEYFYFTGPTTKVEDAMKELSQKLSVGKHRFVASISTTDIVEILTTQYADISQTINRDHTRLSQAITKMIQQYSPSQRKLDESTRLQHATDILNNIEALVSENSTRQANLLKPFSALGDLVSQIFRHKGIQITSGITLGETGHPISSDALSAGEKQMLSFLAYNAFTKDSVIFIDEPEISLHVDWQRILFPTLMSQGTNNQFIVATHSPFIYSKYADKELVLDPDRGG